MIQMQHMLGLNNEISSFIFETILMSRYFIQNGYIILILIYSHAFVQTNNLYG